MRIVIDRYPMKQNHGQWSNWRDWKAVTESKASLWWRHDGRQQGWCGLGVLSQMVNWRDIAILTIIQRTSGHGIGSHSKPFLRFMTAESSDLLSLYVPFAGDLRSELIISWNSMCEETSDEGLPYRACWIYIYSRHWPETTYWRRHTHEL